MNTWNVIISWTRLFYILSQNQVTEWGAEVERATAASHTYITGIPQQPRMYSTLQRLNNITSLATTYVMILLGLISVASFLSVPSLEPGNIDIKDLIMYVSCIDVTSASASITDGQH